MRYTANYSHSNHNFVIQNLEGERVESKYLPAICILKNILQRGKPTLLSTFLQEKIGAIHENRDVFEKPYPLIDTKLPKWDKTIKGDEKQDYNPAKEFFKDLPRYLSECELPDYEFIQQLLLPEASINVIIPPKDGEEEQKFLRQQVDFYLPQARLIIEIDGIDPDTKRPHGNRQENDSGRDRHAKDRGIETVRITTVDLKSKNKTFWKKIEAIRNRIIREQENRRAKNKTFISLNDYKKAFKDGVDLQDHNYLATAIMRFQILLLELLERGLINFNEPWAFEIIERDVKGFAELAIEDLLEWFQHLLNLQKVEFRKPEYKINDKIHSTKATIKIDFSLLQRHDESAQDNESIIFVRNDYLDEFYDHFQVSTYKQKIKYKLKIGEESSDEASLWFLLLNIFLQNNENLNLDTRNFREGQLAIIVNALSCNDTIGLLPTGAGKSVCYQLSAILQPAISFVVCPLKSLMYDQKDELDSVYFTRTNYITSDDDPETRERTMKEFGEGKYLFILITPERFQIKSFRDYLRRVNDRFSIAYAVIDEVHCLSEWGHDFRLSYLNLANTIRNH
ncbi:MAG: DEAD/DEAH box helicase, partial [Candidatus Dadabacteria bacterium]|nr:DEAD/DEAH box helicase [Candidatus Dadabacteria bacterium]